VSGQDPASLDRLDLFQRGQGPVVILVHEPREQLRPGLAAGKAERRQRVARDQYVTVGQAQGHVSGGVAGCVDDAGTARHVQDFFVGEPRHLGHGRRPGHAIAQEVPHQMEHRRLPQRVQGRPAPLVHGRRPVIVVHEHRRARLRPEPFGITHMVRVVMGEHDGLDR
jgi:hypothetical protein